MLPSVAVKGITIKYELGAAEFAERLFGFCPADDNLASLAGALDGATVNVAVRVKKGWLSLAVDDPTRFEAYETSVRRDAQGEVFAYIHEVRVAVGQGGQGLGIRAFSRQVSGARRLGIRYFKLWAAGDYFDNSHNGYYTWARFGFDAPLTARQRELLTYSGFALNVQQAASLLKTPSHGHRPSRRGSRLAACCTPEQSFRNRYMICMAQKTSTK